jgi:hypothetical protein
MNEALETLQDKLKRLHGKLTDQLRETEDREQRRALQMEMVEVTFRLQLVGSLLFAADAEELDDKVKEISAATRRVNAAIAQIAQLKDFLDTVSAFLGLVDEAIDLAKKLLV